jgi:hypothetical protein
MLIWDLCGGSGAWSAPYRDAGYCVEVYDLTTGRDVRLLQRQRVGVWGILAAPDCTDLAASGARWWAAKGNGALLTALSLVDACVRIAWVQQPKWWVLENPVGRLVWYLGPPQMAFNPADYGDPYTKRTLLWGRFTAPGMSRVEATDGSRMHRIPPSPDRKAQRSVTPGGFARAFFEANP